MSYQVVFLRLAISDGSCGCVDGLAGLVHRAGGERPGGAGHGEHGEGADVGERPPRRPVLVVQGPLRRLRPVQLRRDVPPGQVPLQLRRALPEMVLY